MNEKKCEIWVIIRGMFIPFVVMFIAVPAQSHQKSWEISTTTAKLKH